MQFADESTFSDPNNYSGGFSFGPLAGYEQKATTDHHDESPAEIKQAWKKELGKFFYSIPCIAFCISGR